MSFLGGCFVYQQFPLLCEVFFKKSFSDNYPELFWRMGRLALPSTSGYLASNDDKLFSFRKKTFI